MSVLILPIKNMSDRHTGLTKTISNFYYEAACVCLDRHFKPPQNFNLTDDKKGANVNVDWDPVDDRTSKAWANKDDATTNGAYACSLAAVEVSRNLVAVHRAETKTGADYYVAPPDKTYDDLESCYRLEISGTTLDIPYVINRLKNKIKQTQKGRSNLPALAAVIGFKERLILIQTAEIEK